MPIPLSIPLIIHVTLTVDAKEQETCARAHVQGRGGVSLNRQLQRSLGFYFCKVGDRGAGFGKPGCNRCAEFKPDHFQLHMKAGLSWLHAASILLLIWLQINLSLAQVPLPTPAWVPPPAASGAVGSANANRPNKQWSTLLGNLIYFYDAQRSGNLTRSNRVTWRNSSLLNDGQGSADLSGGYYDAGDYIKATFPLAWTLNSICWGVLEFGNGYQDANQTAYLDSALRWGLDWLIKAHPQPNTLYVLVGDDRRDNDYWGGDQNIPTPRPVYQVNDTNPGTDVAAATSAAFSSCALVYGNKTLSSSASVPNAMVNSTYSNVLLTHSRQLLSFAVNATAGMQLYQKAVPQIADIYASSSYYDDLALASIFLGIADSSATYLQLAKTYWDKGALSQGDIALTWDDKHSAIPVLMVEALTSSSSLSSAQDVNVWKTTAEKMLDQIVAADGPGRLTSGGLLYFDGSSDAASLNPALNSAMLLIKYANLATTDSKSKDYLTFAKLQLDYVLGSNPMNMPYVVGINPNSPQNPHSAPASGGSDIGNINTSPMQEAYVLYGAVVGGPDKNDNFWDERRDWVQTEVALDYNAPLLTLVAWKVATDGNDPFYTRLQEGAYAANRPDGTSRPCSNPDVYCPNNDPYSFSQSEQIAVGVILGLGAVAILLMGLWLTYEWQKSMKKGE